MTDTNTNNTIIYGTTIFLDKIILETVYGNFKAYIYLDLITKGNIIALVWDSIDPSKESVLYTRIHSSCVTSETLRSMDCDCVSQLHGALEFMASKSNGILFYLIQEGRGCGYVGKARACMMTQYDDQIDTFEAYNLLGMKKDYREYRNIKDICHMLNITAEFILLTNNPDKIKGLEDVGIKIKSTQSIEIKPTMFNQAYLISKEKSGHLLYETKKKLNKYVLPYDKVEPFNPIRYDNMPRFIYCASYYIPIRPVDNMIILSKEKYEEIKGDIINIPYTELSNNKIYINLSDEIIIKYSIDNPYWFKVNLYYDIATDKEYVILSYNENPNSIPIVRIHSESIFNRFPLTVRKYKDRYTESILKIIYNESGYIILLYNDGRGAGLGNLLLNYNKMGLESDIRDYDACMMLLKNLLEKNNQKSANMLYSNFSRQKIQKAIDNIHVNVINWIPVSDNKGHKSIENRIMNIPKMLANYQNYFKICNNYIDVEDSLIVTGLGSSKAHAKYLEHILKHHMKIEFMSIDDIYKYDFKYAYKLVIFSQGLSPNTHKLFEIMNYQDIILITAITNTKIYEIVDPIKKSIIEKLEENECMMVTIPELNENDTLIRITGPFFGYIACHMIANCIFSTKAKINIDLSKIRFNVQFADRLIKQIMERNMGQIYILAESPIKYFIDNCLDKFTEGIFVSRPTLCDFTEFVHGHYQMLMSCPNPNLIIINVSAIEKYHHNQILIDKIKKSLNDKFNIWEIKLTMECDFQILELEYMFNLMIHYMICNLAIDQVNWPGKSSQSIMYEHF